MCNVPELCHRREPTQRKRYHIVITIDTHRNNACEAEDLSEKEGWIGHEDKEGALEEGVLPDVGELRQQGCDAAHQAAYQETGTEDTKEI